ncbi:hemerythrin domain-containing protein [Azospirillum griseum]|uniref:Hemerythrin domain-containing protein n=1 Tax=Azospirillum griseum TaxID=2496639 RepID=A0A3S0KXN0_9PROT|nr:hemerythrin domain-containing protein [Azospirillum griseum]RTR19196.1 hemerythrin domain-containing protein [Azospirillum griseum]
MDMTSFHTHHSDVLALAAAIERRLDPVAIAANPAPVATDLVQLFGKFSVHLAVEDKALYPRLARAADPALRGLAARFQQEMGGLTQRFEAYRQRWPGPFAIAKDPAGFVAETRTMLDAFKNRIARENAELYPLAERLGAEIRAA